MSRCLSLDSPVFLQRVCWHWLFFQLCSHLYSLSLCVSFKSSCLFWPLYSVLSPLSIPSCSFWPEGLFPQCIGHLLKLTRVALGAGESVWRMVWKMLCGSQRNETQTSKHQNWLFSEDRWRERRGPWIKDKRRVSHVLKGLAQLLVFTSRLASVYYAHANVTSEVFAVFVRSGECVRGETSMLRWSRWAIKTCISVTRFMTINHAKTVIISLRMTLNYFQNKYCGPYVNTLMFCGWLLCGC